jgi:hypothetical protein
VGGLRKLWNLQILVQLRPLTAGKAGSKCYNAVSLCPLLLIADKVIPTGGNMAVSRFKAHHVLIRFVAALVLVCATYNPIDPWSYYHWALASLIEDAGSFSVFKALVGLVIAIGWIIFLRATQRSLGFFGLVLATLFFGLIIWLLIQQGWVGLDNTGALTWLILIALSGIMSLGMSWSHIRRRMSGQLDVDENDGQA